MVIVILPAQAEVNHICRKPVLERNWERPKGGKCLSESLPFHAFLTENSICEATNRMTN
jgi:hypothetical protein